MTPVWAWTCTSRSERRSPGVPIRELESMQGPMKLFDDLPADLQEGMLEMAVDTIEDGSVEQEMDALLAAWAAGDADKIQSTILRETEGLPAPVAQELQAAIYDRRNEAMAVQVTAYLAGKEPVFVAVGAGHLTGESGIPELLKRARLLGSAAMTNTSKADSQD